LEYTYLIRFATTCPEFCWYPRNALLCHYAFEVHSGPFQECIMRSYAIMPLKFILVLFRSA